MPARPEDVPSSRMEGPETREKKSRCRCEERGKTMEDVFDGTEDQEMYMYCRVRCPMFSLRAGAFVFQRLGEFMGACHHRN